MQRVGKMGPGNKGTQCTMSNQKKAFHPPAGAAWNILKAKVSTNYRKQFKKCFLLNFIDQVSFLNIFFAGSTDNKQSMTQADKVMLDHNYNKYQASDLDHNTTGSCCSRTSTPRTPTRRNYPLESWTVCSPAADSRRQTRYFIFFSRFHFPLCFGTWRRYLFFATGRHCIPCT